MEGAEEGAGGGWCARSNTDKGGKGHKREPQKCQGLGGVVGAGERGGLWRFNEKVMKEGVA